MRGRPRGWRMLRGYSKSLGFSAVLVALLIVFDAGCRKTEPVSSLAIEDKLERPAADKNVILIVVDALRADRLTGKRGDLPLMPKVAEFASSSWWFTSATSQAAWTKPSMVSIFTSLYPGVHNVQFGVHERMTEEQAMTADALPDSLQTFASYLKRAGYRTAAIQTNANMQAQFGVDQGFDIYRFSAYPGFGADDVTDAAIETIKELRSPYFLYLHYMDPHAPYDPPAAYRAMFGAPPPITEADKELLTQYHDYYLDHALYRVGINKEQQWGHFSASGRERIRYLYDGEARFIDDEVTRLLEFLETNAGDSVIVFTADHGEELWEHGSIGHGKIVYQEVIDVPLFVRFPAFSPRLIDFPVETIDIVPTLSAFLGLEPSPDWQGRNLIPIVETSSTEPRPIFSRAMGSLQAANLHLESVTVESDKLIVNWKTGVEELYDLSKDPMEQTDLAAERAEKAAQLSKLLQVHTENNREHPKNLTKSRKTTITPEIADKLRDIAYL